MISGQLVSDSFLGYINVLHGVPDDRPRTPAAIAGIAGNAYLHGYSGMILKELGKTTTKMDIPDEAENTESAWVRYASVSSLPWSGRQKHPSVFFGCSSTPKRPCLAANAHLNHS